MYAQKPAPAPAPAPARDTAAPAHRQARVVPDETPVDAIFAERHAAHVLGYGPDLTTGAGRRRVPVAHLAEFEDLLDHLIEIKGVQFATMRELSRQGESEHHPQRLCFKHDVDGDVEIALAMARAEAEHGIRGTYFILPTAPYYGRFDGDVFHRFERMREVYLEIQALGHEVGLHQDPYSLYLRRGLDGAEATVRELQWLRGRGLDIRGAFGHSSSPVNGAESVEIFIEHLDHHPEMSRPGGEATHTEYAWKGGTARRLALSARALGLEYLGELLLRTRTPHGYWGIVAHERCRTGHACGQYGRMPLVTASVPRMVDIIARDLERPLLWQIIDVHPEMYGRRAALERNCEAAAIELAAAQRASRGAFPPRRLVARRARSDRGRDVVAFSFTNELGLFDEPLGARDPNRPAVLLLGGSRLSSPSVSAGAGRWLADLLREERGIEAEVVTAAAPGAGPRQWSRWRKKIIRAIRPKLVLLVAEGEPPGRWLARFGALVRASGGEFHALQLDELIEPGRRRWTGDGSLDAADHEILARRLLARFAESLSQRGAAPGQSIEVKRPPLQADQLQVIEHMQGILDVAQSIDIPCLNVAVAHFRKETTILAQHATAKGHLSHVRDLPETIGLDFACWCGFMTAMMKWLGAAEVHGTDVVPEHVEAARRWSQVHGAAGRGLHFQVNPIDRVPYPDATFDWVIVGGLYSNLNPAATMPIFHELSRVLKPEALLLLNDGGNPRHAATAQRLRRRHREYELGDGPPQAPAGAGYTERLEIVRTLVPDASTEDLGRLARETCYLWRPEIEAAARRWAGSGAWPGSPFQPDDLSRTPVDCANGNGVARPTDPYAIRDELRAAGFTVAYTGHLGGPRLAEEELAGLFAASPAVILVAEKTP